MLGRRTTHGAESVVTGYIRVRLTNKYDLVRNVRTRDPNFLSVDDVVIPIEDGSRLDPGNVGSDARFRHCQRKLGAPVNDPWHEFSLEFRRPKFRDVHAGVYASSHYALGDPSIIISQ